MEEKVLTVVELLLQKAMKKKGELIEKLTSNDNEADRKELSETENRLKTLRMIKAELIKKNDKKDYTLERDKEIKVLIGMKEERDKYVDVYNKANRIDLAQNLIDEISVISEFIPAQPDDEEVRQFAINVIDNYLSEQPEGYKLSKRDMGKIMPLVKSFYPNVNGKIVEEALTSKM